MIVRSITADWVVAEYNVHVGSAMQHADNTAPVARRMTAEQRMHLDRAVAGNARTARFLGQALVQAFPPANDSNYQAA